MSHKGSLAELIPELEEELPASRNGRRRTLESTDSPTFKPLHPKEIEALVLEHIDLANRLAWSLLNRWRVRLGEDDVQSATGAALCEAASRFDATRGVSFRTFLFYHLRGVLLKEISKRVNENRARGNDEYFAAVSPGRNDEEWRTAHSDQLSPEELLLKEELAVFCRRACSQLDALEQKIIFRFFVLDQSVVEIARELGYCRCHISRIKSQVLHRLARTLRHFSEPEASAAERVVPEGLCESERGRHGSTGGRGRRKKAI
jgi:RNA polymerase sigma factor (sigma-70 family)